MFTYLKMSDSINERGVKLIVIFDKMYKLRKRTN